MEKEEKEANDNVGHQCIRNKMFYCVVFYSFQGLRYLADFDSFSDSEISDQQWMSSK